MELFKIFGKIAVDNSEANKALEETGGKLKKFGAGVLAIGKAVGVGMIAAGTAVAGLVTKSVQAYADYEQLVGGVETLFGAGGQSLEEYAQSVGKSVQEASDEYDKLMRSQNKVLENSKKAFKTAGLSANDYMETVTSFSASLLQSLGGDTEAAAEVADRAIIDMSDNANKMGTDMALIQNAYNGFAKQNYTMLDNLKLGYGGTQEEMKRLIADAAQMTDIQERLGITVDESSMSFGNIVNAISIMQESMGIAGTTSKEAASTISGSIGMMKASWQNLIVGMADEEADFGAYVNEFANSVSTVAANLIPRIEIALGGVGLLIEQLAPIIIAEIPGLIQKILPSLVSGAASLLTSLAAVLPDLAIVLIQQIPVIFGSIRQTLENQFPNLKKPFEVMEGLFNGIWEAMQIIWDSIGKPIFDAVSNAFASCKDSILPLIAAFGDYVTEGQFATDITNAAKKAVDFLKNAYESVSGFINGVVQGFKDVVTWGKEHETALTMIGIAVGTLTAAIVAYNVAQGIKNAGGIVELAQLGLLQVQIWGLQVAEMAHTAASWLATTATTAFGAAMAFLTSPITLVVLAIGALIAIVVLCVKHWDKIKEAGAKAWEWIKNAWSSAGEWFSNIWSKIQGAFANVGSWFKEKFTSAKNGIVNAFANIKEKLTAPFTKARDTIKGIADKIKGFFKGEISFPKIKKPHFGISPSGWKIGDLLKGSIPKLSIDWYAKAMDNPVVMTQPTVFGYNSATGQLMGGGEAGSEVVSGTNTLMNMIRSAVAEQNGGLSYYLQRLLEILADYFPQVLSAMDRDVVLDSGEMVGALAVPMNQALGRLASRKGRGI